jgi:hypothetical protein
MDPLPDPVRDWAGQGAAEGLSPWQMELKGRLVVHLLECKGRSDFRYPRNQRELVQDGAFERWELGQCDADQFAVRDTTSWLQGQSIRRYV